MTNTKQREQAIKEVLIQYSRCNGKTFDCQDPNLQTDRFEQKSHIDFKPDTINKENNIQFLLKIRAKVNFRIKIAEEMIKRLAG